MSGLHPLNFFDFSIVGSDASKKSCIASLNPFPVRFSSSFFVVLWKLKSPTTTEWFEYSLPFCAYLSKSKVTFNWSFRCGAEKPSDSKCEVATTKLTGSGASAKSKVLPIRDMKYFS